MIIRPAASEMRSEVIALWHAAGLTRPWNDPRADFDLAMDSAGSTILTAHLDANIVGSVMAGFDGHRGWVYYLATEPNMLRKGIGRMLMSAAEDFLRSRGCPRIRLMVRGDNLEARSFYRSIGYVDQDVITMGRALDG